MTEGSAPPPPAPSPLTAARVAELGKLFVARALRSNLQFDHATADERRALESAPKPIYDEIAQDYAVWRRAMLWIAAVLMAVSSVVKLINWIGELSGNDLPSEFKDTYGVIVTILFLYFPAATALVAAAAWKWSDLRASRRLARFAWFTFFLVPILSSMVPWVKITNPELESQAQMGVGLVIGIVLFAAVVPSILSLPLGLIRSSMTLKTLLPESGAPGWTTIFFGPLYALIFASILIVVIQTVGNALLMLAVACLVVAPLIYLWNARLILRPHTPSEVSTVIVAVRRKVLLVNLIGVGLIAGWAIDRVFEVLDAVEVLIVALCGILLLAVVGSDFILAMLCLLHRRGKEFFGTEMADSLDRKFEALSDVGLTRLDVSMKTTSFDAPPRA